MATKCLFFLCVAATAASSCRRQQSVTGKDGESDHGAIEKRISDTATEESLRKNTTLRVECYLAPSGEREYIVSYRCSGPDLAPPDVNWARLAESMDTNVKGAPMKQTSTAAYYAIDPDTPKFAQKYHWERLNGRSTWHLWPESAEMNRSQNPEAQQTAPSDGVKPPK